MKKYEICLLRGSRFGRGRLCQNTASRQHDVGIEKVVINSSIFHITRVWMKQIVDLKMVRIRGDAVCTKIRHRGRE